MNVELFAISDFAAEYGGKLSVVGIFDTLYAKQAPVVHPHWCVAVKLRFDKIEEGQKRFRLTITDADGKTVIPPVEMPFAIPAVPEASSATLNLVMNLGGVKFANFGEYSIDLALDGRHEASTPLWVRQQP